MLNNKYIYLWSSRHSIVEIYVLLVKMYTHFFIRTTFIMLWLGITFDTIEVDERKTPKTAKENTQVVESAYSIYILTANLGDLRIWSHLARGIAPSSLNKSIIIIIDSETRSYKLIDRVFIHKKRTPAKFNIFMFPWTQKLVQLSYEYVTKFMF